MGLFPNSCRPAKNDPAGRSLDLPLPLPHPPKKKTIHDLSKTPSHQDPSDDTNVLTPGQIPWEVPIHETTTTDLRR